MVSFSIRFSLSCGLHYTFIIIFSRVQNTTTCRICPIVAMTTTRTGTSVVSAFWVCRWTESRPACPLWLLTNTAYQVKEKKMKTDDDDLVREVARSGAWRTPSRQGRRPGHDRGRPGIFTMKLHNKLTIKLFSLFYLIRKYFTNIDLCK